MENNCKNCGTLITDNFCGNCGQKKYKRIDKKYLIDELQYSLLHTNKGFFYSIKNIIKNPGKTAKDFIDGNRVNHYKPILLAFVLSGISAFISIKIVNLSDVMELYYSKQEINITVMHKIMSFVNNYNSFIMLFSLPFISILTFFTFKNWKNNYYEHIIMNAYIQCCYTIFCIIILYPILYLLKEISSDIFITIVMISMLSIPVIMVWFYKEFYKEKKFSDILVRILIFIAIIAVLYVATIVIGIIIYTMINGLESLKELAPKK